MGNSWRKVSDIHLKDNLLSIINNSRNFIAKVSMTRNRMFVLNIQNEVAKYIKMCYKDASGLWNLRSGHLNFGGLELFSRKEMAKELTHIHHLDQVCEGCLLRKQFKASFPKESNPKAQKPLELIYTNMCGPITPNLLGKSN